MLAVLSQVIIVITSLLNLYMLIMGMQKIELIHKSTNSMKDELVAEVRAASLAKGALDQRTSDVRSMDTTPK